MDTLWRDLRFAFRNFTRTPGFAAVAVLTLALGLGANTVIFGVVRGVLLEPLDYERPGEIVRVWPEQPLSEQLVDHLEERLGAVSVQAAYVYNRFTLTGVDRPEELAGAVVGDRFFELLGVEAALGRTFSEQEGEAGRNEVVVLSHRLWQRRFGGDRQVIGQRLTLGGSGSESRTVIGVLPAEFQPLDEEVELWVPLAPDPADAHQYSDMIYLGLLGRLAPGTGVGEAAAELRTAATDLPPPMDEYFGRGEPTAGAVPLKEYLIDDVRPSLLLLAAAVALVLLMACANVANLMLARAGGRRREVLVRAALGAGRWRLLRQLLTESALLGALGGLGGLLLAAWSEGALASLLPGDLPRGGAIHLGGPELAFTAVASLLTALLCGLVPALRLSRDATRPASSGSETVRGAGGSSRRLNRLLVAVQVALAVVLVVAAGLTASSLWRLQQVDPGFMPRGLLTLRLAPPPSRYTDEAAQREYFDRVDAAIERVPGVAAVGGINMLPVTPGGMGAGYSPTESPDPTAEPLQVSFRAVRPGYFRSLGAPLLDGRLPSADDRVDAPPVGLINRTLAERHWPGGQAVGEQLYWDDGSLWLTIVGVVGDVHQNRLDRAPRAEVYMPYEQLTTPSLYLTVRAADGGGTGLEARVTDAVLAVDPDVAIADLRWMDQVLARSLVDSRFLAALLSLFGALALLLGAVGVYGVASYAVSRRQREMGIRLALGAEPRRLLLKVMGGEMVPVLCGVAAGLAAALAASRALAGLLYGVSATEPRIYAAVALALAIAGLAASYLPARRAASADPRSSLAAE